MVGIVPPFGDYVIRAEEITPFGMNETSKLMIKPPAKVQLSDLKAGTEYRVCVYNQYDQLAGGIVPDQYCTSFKPRLINATRFFLHKNVFLTTQITQMVVFGTLLTF